MLGPNWMPSSNDVIPQNNEELWPYMRQLHDATMDMSQFEDSINNSSFQKRWLDKDYETRGQNGPVLSNKFYMPHMLEWLAWKIVYMYQQLHLYGPSAVDNQEPLILEASFEDAGLTFDQRIAILVDVCRKRKSRVESMPEAGMLE